MTPHSDAPVQELGDDQDKKKKEKAIPIEQRNWEVDGYWMNG